MQSTVDGYCTGINKFSDPLLLAYNSTLTCTSMELNVWNTNDVIFFKYHFSFEIVWNSKFKTLVLHIRYIWAFIAAF